MFYFHLKSIFQSFQLKIASALLRNCQTSNGTQNFSNYALDNLQQFATLWFFLFFFRAAILVYLHFQRKTTIWSHNVGLGQPQQMAEKKNTLIEIAEAIF